MGGGDYIVGGGKTECNGGTLSSTPIPSPHLSGRFGGWFFHQNFKRYCEASAQFCRFLISQLHHISAQSIINIHHKYNMGLGQSSKLKITAQEHTIIAKTDSK